MSQHVILDTAVETDINTSLDYNEEPDQFLEKSHSYDRKKKDTLVSNDKVTEHSFYQKRNTKITNSYEDDLFISNRLDG